MDETRPIPPHLDLVSWRLGDYPNMKFWCDGVEVSEVVAYSITDGWLESYAHDEQGNPILNPDKLGYVIHRQYGVITAKWME